MKNIEIVSFCGFSCSCGEFLILIYVAGPNGNARRVNPREVAERRGDPLPGLRVTKARANR
jgi:hypothetical protein